MFWKIQGLFPDIFLSHFSADSAVTCWSTIEHFWRLIFWGMCRISKKPQFRKDWKPLIYSTSVYFQFSDSNYQSCPFGRWTLQETAWFCGLSNYCQNRHVFSRTRIRPESHSGKRWSASMWLFPSLPPGFSECYFLHLSRHPETLITRMKYILIIIITIKLFRTIILPSESDNAQPDPNELRVRKSPKPKVGGPSVQRRRDPDRGPTY